MNKLSSDFLLEIIRICFVKKSVLEIVREHLKYQYIPEELKELKKILKAIITYYDTHNSVPSFGYVSQSYPNDIEVQSALSEIKRVDVADADELIRQLETYIKNTRFHQLYEKVHKLYNDDKADEAILLNAEESESIVNFSITKASSYFYKLFSGFEDRQKQKEISRQNGDYVHDKVPTGIREIDEVLYGGIDKGDTACFLARSKGGKSTLLKYIGTYDARLGYDVLHVSAEDSLDVCIDKYNQVWTGQKYINIKYGDLDLDERGWEKIEKVIRQMKVNEREIYIHAYEQFDEANCRELRELIIKYFKENGKYPDIILLDSLDLFLPGDGRKYGIDTQSMKMRKENTARKLKNIAVEFNTRIATVDQADGIPKEKWNDPDFLMTSHNASLAKGLNQSFSYYITLNQTEDEKKNNIMRLGFSELRNYYSEKKFVRIATRYDIGKFYDMKRTQEMFEQSNKVGEVKAIKKGKVRDMKKDSENA